MHVMQVFRFQFTVQVIANDVDFRRCNLLIHQTKRMCSANLIVTNHEAQNFPSCLFKPEREMAIDKLPYGIEACNEPQKLTENQLAFDRVLCDVPCSGDGTLRKAPDLWRKWYESHVVLSIFI